MNGGEGLVCVSTLFHPQDTVCDSDHLATSHALSCQSQHAADDNNWLAAIHQSLLSQKLRL